MARKASFVCVNSCFIVNSSIIFDFRVAVRMITKHTCRDDIYYQDEYILLLYDSSEDPRSFSHELEIQSITIQDQQYYRMHDCVVST